MNDQTLTCRDCGQSFVWTAGEQEFYQTKGLSAPTRCRDCRAKRKLERNSQGGMSSGPREMYDITCANCGKQGQVPFRPMRDDVLCKECFAAKRDGGDTAPAADDAANA